VSFADGNAVESRTRDCPKCAMPSVKLPRFVTRRRSPVTCAHCGTKLERVLPGVPYYTLATVTGLLAEAAVPVSMVLLLGRVAWIFALVIGLFLLNLGVSAFLNSRTRVEYVDPADGRHDVPGRWYPR
jgi:hypothetical protein